MAVSAAGNAFCMVSTYGRAHRAALRTKQAEMETSITNAADTAALETLYARNNSGVRPLGDLPRLT